MLNTCRSLEEEGLEVTYVRPDQAGLVHAEAVAGELRDDTILISVMHVSESLLLELDLKGVAVSSGSACTSATGEPSHVLVAMGIPYEICRGALRFSLGKENTEADIDYVLGVLPGIVGRIRAMSPLSPG